MKKLRQRITPARWRKLHFGILGTGVFLVLLNLGMGLWGSVWGGALILAAVLLLLDGVGYMLFFRCPACGSSRLEFWSGRCPDCGETIDFRRDRASD